MNVGSVSEVRAWIVSVEGCEPRERVHTDRPHWAYDKDGNCYACGNGHWKSHAPWCEIAYLIERAIDAGDELYVKDPS